MKKIAIILFLIPFLSVSCKQKGHNVEADSEETKSTVALQNVDAETALLNELTKSGEDLSGKVITLTSEEFIQKITDIHNPKSFQYKGETPCIVDCYTDWCPPCRRLYPVLVNLAEKYKGKLIIYKINVDNTNDLNAAFEINSIPTLLFFKRNAQPGKIVGAPTEEELNTTIVQFLNN